MKQSGRTNLVVLALVLALLQLPCKAWSQPEMEPQSNLLQNGSFESPDLNSNPPPKFGPYANLYLPYYAYPYYKTGGYSKIAYWKYYDNSVIIDTQPSGVNPWYGYTPPSGFDGLQFAAIQHKGKFSQQFTVVSPGSYTVQWLAGGRPNCKNIPNCIRKGVIDGNQTYAVLINETQLGVFKTVTGQDFAPESAPVELNAGSYVISFIGKTKTGDHTAFIDDVSIVPQ